MFLEVIATNLDDVLKINQSQADRIELCGAMDEDGLTPDIELIKKAAQISTTPIRVMIRNHNNGFVFTDLEITRMCEQIEQINQIDNIDGYVIGAITKDQQIDVQGMKRLILASGNRNITCHKAIELLISNETIKNLSELGVNTVLTQGGVKPIMENTAVLKEITNYQRKNHPEFQVLIGGGVNMDNLRELSLINPVIHVGKLIRYNNSYDSGINVDLINQIKNI